MTSCRYRLIANDGRDLGPLVSSRSHWPIGAMITGAAGDLRVTAVVEAEPGEDFQEYLVVEQRNVD